jgi:hypothetical protein
MVGLYVTSSGEIKHAQGERELGVRDAVVFGKVNLAVVPDLVGALQDVSFEHFQPDLYPQALAVGIVTPHCWEDWFPAGDKPSDLPTVIDIISALVARGMIETAVVCRALPPEQVGGWARRLHGGT